MSVNEVSDYGAAVEERRHLERMLEQGREEFSGYGLELFERGLRSKIEKLTSEIHSCESTIFAYAIYGSLSSKPTVYEGSASAEIYGTTKPEFGNCEFESLTEFNVNVLGGQVIPQSAFRDLSDFKLGSLADVSVSSKWNNIYSECIYACVSQPATVDVRTKAALLLDSDSMTFGHSHGPHGESDSVRCVPQLLCATT
jgi:hypothetical protein